jgi:serine/threonine-protein kinase
MASVYLGRAIGKAGFERRVAVKVIHPHLASEPEFVEMFLDEARIAAKIHDPHVVETLDLGESAGVSYMVMEYVEGDTLASLLRQLRKAESYLPTRAVLQIVIDACRGLAAAHDLRDAEGRSLHLVHRDVSPHNLLVSMDGRVKVVDFGIMKAAGKRSSTLTGQLRGKIAYMSPEQAKSLPVDHRTDLFALGAVLWELCTNRRLFAAGSDAETLDKVLRCETPAVLERREDLPSGLQAILGRTLAADPDDRYESAHAMLKAVRALARELDEEEDPREVLARTMRRFFSGRVAYINAALRGAAGESEEAPTQMTGLKTPTEQLGSTPGSLAAAGIGMQTASSLIGAPARHWMLWLLLPLVGAAVGTAAMRWEGREPSPSPMLAEPSMVHAARSDRDPEPRPQGATLASATTVKWWFNTVPQGAWVYIDGVRHDEPTPTAIELPRGEEVKQVRITKEGFVSRELRMAPVVAGNHTFPLEAVQEPKRTPLRFRAKSSKSSKPHDASSQGSGGKEPEGNARPFATIPGLSPEKPSD